MGIRCADHVTSLYPQKLVLTSPTGGGRSVGIVRSRTKATEFFFCWCLGTRLPTIHHFMRSVYNFREMTLRMSIHTFHFGDYRTEICDALI